MVTRTSRLDFGSGLDADQTYQWETKHKLFSLAEVCALPSAILVFACNWTIKHRWIDKKKIQLFANYNQKSSLIGLVMLMYTER